MSNYEKFEMEIVIFSADEVFTDGEYISGDASTGGGEWEDADTKVALVSDT